LAKSLYENLNAMGIKVDLSYHRKLKFYFKKVSRDIEGSSKFIKNYSNLKKIKGLLDNLQQILNLFIQKIAIISN